jgi:uncharacterized protein YuzB (UPF0349 family)
MTLFTDKEICKAIRATLECESPLEISLIDDPTSRATGQLASEILAHANRIMRRNYAYHELEKLPPELKIVEYTCLACSMARKCDWAFDDKNINGHCVME